jgi:endonuclease/exonuclease/phosphatase family metal-dependent hydrolase
VRLRVLVYNVRGFRDGPDRVVAVIRRLSPDLVLLNETGGRRTLRRFARAVEMRAAADPWSPLRRRVKDAVLVRPPWVIRRRRLIRFAGSERWYPRGALVASLAGQGRHVWAVAVHLGLHPGERRRHVDELTAEIDRLENPVILGGDLNELPTGRAVARLAQRLRDAWLLGGDVAGETFPADEPTARIDYLFVSEDVRVERVMVPPTPDVRAASDHRPVVAEVALTGSDSE